MTDASEQDDFRQGVQLTLTMAMTLAARNPHFTGGDLALALRETLEETVFDKSMGDLMWKPLVFRDLPEPEPAHHYPPFAGGVVSTAHPTHPAPPNPRSNSASDIADWLEVWILLSAPGGSERKIAVAVYSELAAGKAINAIKEYRNSTGTGLRESKDGVLEFRDRLVRSGKLPLPSSTHR